MTPSRDDLLKAVDLFASAGLDQALWPLALERLAELTGSSHAQLIGVGGPRQVHFNVVPDLPAKATLDFITIDGGSSAINPRMAAVECTGVLEVVSDEMLDAYRRTVANSDYNDFKSTYDIPFGCQMTLDRDKEGIVALVLLRSSRQGPTRPEQVATFSFLAPWAASSVRLHGALNFRGTSLLAGMLESMDCAGFICDANARVLARSALAESLLGSGHLAIESGKLAAETPRASAELRKAISIASFPLSGDTPAATSLVVHAKNGNMPLVLDIFPMSDTGGLIRQSGHALVVARRRIRLAQNSEEILMDAFGLTRFEAKTACTFLSGASRQQIAESRGVSPGTVHTQIKSIFAKCDVNRETELVAKLLGILAS